MNHYEVIRRPLVTEKGSAKKEAERTLCFEVAPESNKIQIRAAIERLFKVKVESVRTVNVAGKRRGRGNYAGYLADTKKAYVRLKEGQKVPEYEEMM